MIPRSAIVFGNGTIGSALVRELQAREIPTVVVERNSVLDASGASRNILEWQQLADGADVGFIAIPSTGTGDAALAYELHLLSKGKSVVSCEKASIAHAWDTLRQYGDRFRYSASVGGGTRMLKAIAAHRGDIRELSAVVNGTLNYLGDGLVKGHLLEDLVHEAYEKGYTEPGSSSFGDIIRAEMNDVVMKAVIIANTTGMFSRTMTDADVTLIGQDGKDITAKRCIVRITPEGIEAGFIEDTNAAWLPTGVDNALFVNGVLEASGPGAGADPTVSAMLADLQELP